MLISDYAFILACRGINIPSTWKKGDLEKACGEITSVDLERLSVWNYIISQVDKDVYSLYEKTELVSFLELKTMHTFGIPLNMLGKGGRRAIVAYYVCQGFSLHYPEKTWTPDQQRVLDIEYTGICIVNAGPGTGKTTTANERAIRLIRHLNNLNSSSGVLLLSYTNEAIRENHTRLHEYYGLKGILGKKDWTKRLNVVTADSLATKITSFTTGSDSFDDTHDSCIKNAIDRILTDTSAISKFMIPGQGCKYSHIIVDECQDIDDLRGELIVNFFRKMGCKSLTLFGDPRQKIRTGCGKWYTDLWTGNYVFTEIPYKKIPSTTKVGFTFSHRFTNTKMIDLVNSISSIRSDLHHQLECSPDTKFTLPETPIDFIAMPKIGYEDFEINMAVSFIRKIVSSGTSYTQIAVIGPSIGKNNSTSTLGKRIYTVFKDSGIPCFTRSEGSYSPNAVLFTTIHSAKGKEFDYVFIYGMSDYPNTFQMIPHDEAESLIYVVHSRARIKNIYFGYKNNFILPRGINPEYVKDLPSKSVIVSNISRHTAVTNFKVSDICSDFGLQSFLDYNGYKCNYIEMENLQNTLPNCPKGITKRFWGIICGLAVETMISNRHNNILIKFVKGDIIFMENKVYREMVFTGMISNGIHILDNKLYISSESINSPRPEEIVHLMEILLKPLMELTITDWVEIATIYDYLINGNMSSRYEKITDTTVYADITQQFKSVGDEITHRFGKGDIEEKVNDLGYIGSIDTITNNYILEYKTNNFTRDNALQVYMYKTLFTKYESNKPAILIDLINGKVNEVKSNENHLRWRYILQAFYTLKTHVDYVQYRINCSLSKGIKLPKFEPNTFTVDTEFNGLMHGDIEIFDLAVVNMSDPFKSLVQTINVKNSIGASNWLHCDKELIDTSPPIQRSIELFDNITRLYPVIPTLMYYSCNVDVSWLYEKVSVNLGQNARKLGRDTGIILNGTQPPKLTDIYGVMSNSLEFQDHLTPHTALSDALMLFEMAHLGII